AAHGFGGHANRLLGTAEAAAAVEACLRPGPGAGAWLLQRDVSDCMLLGGRRFTLRLYLVVVEGPPRRAFLATRGLVYRALEGSCASNCSQAALRSRGSSTAAGAEACPDLEWLWRHLAARRGAGAPAALRRRLRRLAALLAHGPLWEALETPVGEVAEAGWAAPLRVPKVLGLDVIVGGGADGGEPWPWLLEVNRFPGLGLRAPSDAAVKLPVVRDAWAEALGMGGGAGGCLVELGRPVRAKSAIAGHPLLL
ncbi:unnamed protein product, partial [Prorocentrum cordatum]